MSPMVDIAVGIAWINRSKRHVETNAFNGRIMVAITEIVGVVINC